MKSVLKNILLIISITMMTNCSNNQNDSSIFNSSTEEVSSSEKESSNSSISEAISSSSNEISSESSSSDSSIVDPPTILKEREDRNLSTTPTTPSNEITEDKFIKSRYKDILKVDNDYIMKSSSFNLKFALKDSRYSIEFIDNKTNTVMFEILKPAKVYFRGNGQIENSYTSIEILNYGILAKVEIPSPNGSKIQVEDRYYYPSNEIASAINVQRALYVLKASKNDKGFESIYGIETLNSDTSSLQYFVPNGIFDEITNLSEAQPYKLYRETLTGLPLCMVRDDKTGYSVSLARYKPVIDYKTNSYACVSVHKGLTSSGEKKSSIEITYPSRDTSRKYFEVKESNKIVYDLTLMAFKTDNFDDAMIEHYTNQYLLQDQRIVNTNIDTCYKVINEDFKSLMLSTTKNGITSYGLPWRVTIENGKIGPKSYQAGFVGQQIPCAYNMMLYGLKYNDLESLNNGINIINFWVNDAKMMSDAGVPKIWYDGSWNGFFGYPTFTRMAVDAMEGLFDAYRLAKAYNIEVHGWYEAVKACADWFTSCQNSDGSYYRCYNYQGTYYQGNESEITWNPGDIARSTSKNNSTMPVRFLGKMYEFTNDTKYLNAVKKAGDFIYKNLYPQHKYFGGTCDNPDAMDKEAGVYAMYAYDTLYTLTKDSKWLDCLKQATIFTMSSVLTISFKIPETASSLKAAYSIKCGYTDGLSYICCNGTSLDNYAAYIYYQLFRLYIYSNEKVYYDMAEFIQQNTKSTMDWDGTLNYPYKSLTPEASTIYSFGYNSALDDDGVAGVWLPWQSAANAEPIAKMYDTFNETDVKALKDYSNEELNEILLNYGVGGKAHRKF